MRPAGEADDMDLGGPASGDGWRPCWEVADTRAAEGTDTLEHQDVPAQRWEEDDMARRSTGNIYAVRLDAMPPSSK